MECSYLETRSNLPSLSSNICDIKLGGFFRYVQKMEAQLTFERFFIEQVAAMVEEKGIKHDPFGIIAFKNKSGGRAWRACRSNERKRGLTLEEARGIAEALGTDLPTLIWKIDQLYKNR